GPDGQDGNLWLVNDGRSHQASEYPHIRHGECAVLGIFWLKLMVAGIFSQIVYLFGQPYQIKLVCIFYYRYNQIAVRKGSGHPHIDVLFQDDTVPFHRTIYEWILFKATHDRFDE